MNPIAPSDITADRKNKQVVIKWNDGKESKYTFALLRNACPCAECRAEQDNKVAQPGLDDLSLTLIDSRTTMIRKLDLVGNYAVTFEWEDGHHFGIYNWEYLRSIDQDEYK
jgi:DUF971 family protein